MLPYKTMEGIRDGCGDRCSKGHSDYSDADNLCLQQKTPAWCTTAPSCGSPSFSSALSFPVALSFSLSRSIACNELSWKRVQLIQWWDSFSLDKTAPGNIITANNKWKANEQNNKKETTNSNEQPTNSQQQVFWLYCQVHRPFQLPRFNLPWYKDIIQLPHLTYNYSMAYRYSK